MIKDDITDEKSLQWDRCHVDVWNDGKQLDTIYMELLNNLNSLEITYAEYITTK